MIKIENVEVMGWEHTIRGIRNTMGSWNKSDSGICKGGDDGIGCENCVNCDSCAHAYDHSWQLGKADHDLMMRLEDAGYRRMITVNLDITAPLYWWKEYDTYKVGTVANSTSTMHKIHANPFSREDFSCDRMTPVALDCLDHVIAVLEERRLVFVETKERAAWDDLIQLLPSSYNQMRTCTLNYENLLNIYFARRAHKLPEWHVFCDWILTLPYMDAFTKAAERE